MKPRQLLAGILGGLLGSALAAGPDPRVQDLRLEEQISQAQKLSVEAGQAYQEWLNGRIKPKAAETLVESRLQGMAAFQGQAATLAAPVSQTSVRHWARMQKQELQYYLTDIRQKPPQPRTQALLQQRWQNAVEIQSDLLETRRRQLQVVEKQSGNPRAVAYYRWRAQMLPVLQAELNLARDVAQAFQQQNQTARLTGKALALHDLAAAIQPPAFCKQAHQLYVERFVTLGRLCASAQQAISAPDQDSVSNLQDDEEVYRKKALASDDASLAVLSSLLSKPR
ncbi:hypothetical protein ABS71_15455 [bacterium SCN 62-11]|nr:hypothetical protein [Candidatus Eremiobacteraeota bacterium]ODT62627.1 MAG: hypothetical protein ABS71_15455 [bacterium SCN 62-11]